MFSAKNDQTDNKLSSNFQSEENCLQKIYNDENMSSNLRQYAGWKEITTNVKYQVKIFYLPELLVFDDRVKKISFKSVNIPPTSKQKGFQQFSVRHKK